MEHSIITNMFADNAFNTDAAQQIKSLVSCPVVTVNKIHDAQLADTMLKMGKADFIAMGRESLADPYYPTKVKEGRFDEINYCIGCLQGCMAGMLTPGGHVTCLVNPRCCNEVEHPFKEAETKKNVLVVGVSFCMGTEVTADLLTAQKPDAIVLATGSRPLVPQIPGIAGKNVVFAEDVLLGNVDVKPGPVVVCGGGEVGGETAEVIAQTNHDVTILEMRPSILADMFIGNMGSLLQHIQANGIRSITNATVTAINETGVSYSDGEGKIHTIPAATVVSAFGYRAYNPLEETAKAACKEVHVVGSAVKAGNALVAIREGYLAGMAL